jgi:hypothetical protein
MRLGQIDLSIVILPYSFEADGMPVRLLCKYYSQRRQRDGGHPHRRHRGHEKRYGDLRAGDRYPVGSRELDAKRVASRRGVGGSDA